MDYSEIGLKVGAPLQGLVFFGKWILGFHPRLVWSAPLGLRKRPLMVTDMSVSKKPEPYPRALRLDSIVSRVRGLARWAL